MTRRHPRATVARNRRGTLGFVTAMLLGAGAIRLTLGLDEANAVEAVQRAVTPAPAAANCTEPAPPENLAALVEALKAREARIASREATLAERRQTLALGRRALDDKLAELKAAEKRLSRNLALASTAAEADVAQLTKVYENMKARDAAPVFEQMAPAFAAGFLGRMKPENAAAIMAGLTPEKAYSVSVMLAGRNAAATRD